MAEIDSRSLVRLLTPTTVRALERALAECLGARHREVGIAHLLVGICEHPTTGRVATRACLRAEMRLDRTVLPPAVRRLVLAVVALASCGAPAPPEVVTATVPTRPAPAPSAEAAPKPPRRPRCEAFVEAAVSSFVSKIPVRDDFSPDWFRQGICVESPRGAWALVYEKVDVQEGPPPSPIMASAVEITARWRLAHVDPAGQRVLGDGGTIRLRPHAADSVRVEAPFDYDGDGADEVLVTRSTGTWDSGESHGAIYTVRGGAIAKYAATDGLDVSAVEDVDGDGLPDLLYFGPYRAESRWCSWEPDSSQFIRLAAHARPGGAFSMNDAAASEHARKQCPSKPDPPAIEPFGSASMLAVRCARLWGMPARDAMRAIRKVCTGQKPGCGRSGKGNCEYDDALVAWANAEPPLTLKP